MFMELIKFNKHKASFNLQNLEPKKHHIKKTLEPVVDIYNLDIMEPLTTVQ